MISKFYSRSLAATRVKQPFRTLISESIKMRRYATKEQVCSLPNNPEVCSKSSFDALSFPCLEALEKKNDALFGGPEPSYNHVAKGHKTYRDHLPLKLDHGNELPYFEIAYETWGELNADKSNAILIHTGLSASSHAHSHADNSQPGWWEKFIGPGLSIDTNKFFVICTNVLGGCYGSTGPSSFMSSDLRLNESSKVLNEDDLKGAQRYATRFPILTIFDMIRAQFRLLDSLEIETLHASVGASMGGMQSLAAGVLFTDRVKRIVTISACARSHPYSIALRHCQRQGKAFANLFHSNDKVLMTDPNWNKGEYYGKIPPHVGMKLAREIATITYRSGPEWEKRFGRTRAEPDSPPALCPDFLIETYLDHQSEKFCLNYDANSLLYISKAMDMFDLSADSLLALAQTSLQVKVRFQAAGHQDDLTTGLSILKSIPTLILGVQSDILFPCWQQKEIADCLRKAGNPRVHFYELDAMYGHDTFLIDLNAVGPAIKGHLEHDITAST